MGRPGISQQEVFEAADSLFQEGQSISVNAVRDRLGAGSYSTIGAHLANWREENDAKKLPDVPEPPPAVITAVRQLWSVAWHEAQARLKVERDAFEAATRQMDQERKDMVAEITSLEDSGRKHEAEILRLTDQLTEGQRAAKLLEEEKIRLSTDVARLTERIKGLESLAAEHKEQLDKLVERIPKITGESSTSAAADDHAKPSPDRRPLHPKTSVPAGS